MKRVMVHAYTQFNLGDDLFIKILCERYPRTSFVLSAPEQYKSRFKNMSNLRVLPNDSLINRGFGYVCRQLNMYHLLMRLLSIRCDAIVLVGGSLFMQDNHWLKNLEHKQALIMRGKPFFLLGTNFGPYDDDQFYLAHKKLFKHYTDICFRDQYSHDLFNDLPQVRVASDIIFQLSKQETKHYEKSIVISVIKPSIRKHLATKDSIYYQKIKEMTIYFIDNGYTVTLMSFCEFERDHEAVEIIAKSIPAYYLHKLTKYSYQGDIEEALHIIATSRFVIATRFHAMILGWLYEKPVFPIVYSEKMKHVMNDIEFSGAYTDFDQLDDLDPAQVFSSMNQAINITAQIKDAEKHFAILDKHLLSDEKG